MTKKWNFAKLFWSGESGESHVSDDCGTAPQATQAKEPQPLAGSGHLSSMDGPVGPKVAFRCEE